MTPIGRIDVLLRGGPEGYALLAAAATWMPAGHRDVRVAPLDDVLHWRVRFGRVPAGA